MTDAADKLEAQVLLQDLRQHEKYPALRRYLLGHYPELSAYNGEQETIDAFKRESFQREGMDILFKALGVKHDE